MKYTEKFGTPIWRHYSRQWMDDDTLEGLVNSVGFLSDDGECAYNEYEFYELTDDGWVNIPEEDVKAAFDKRDEREQENYKRQRERVKTKLWQVKIPYPSVTEVWSRFETHEEALACLSDLPKELGAYVEKKDIK